MFRDEFSLPGSDSQDAQDLLEAHGFNDRAGFGGMVVVEDDDGFGDPAVRQQLDALFAKIQDDVSRSSVVSPFTDTEVELAGDIFVEPQQFASEGVGLLAAMVVLLVAFGSVLAMACRS